MAAQRTYPASVTRPAPASAPGTLKPRPGILERRRASRNERKQARLVSARNRRVLAQWLRRIAKHSIDSDPISRRRDPLLHYRAAAVRTELLEIASLVEHTHDPDPACVKALHNLLANGCHSPLYNPNIHVSELRATLDYIRAGLAAHA